MSVVTEGLSGTVRYGDAYAPWRNDYAERLIGSIRRECPESVGGPISFSYK
jgi:hypothetical protein